MVLIEASISGSGKRKLCRKNKTPAVFMELKRFLVAYKAAWIPIQFFEEVRKLIEN